MSGYQYYLVLPLALWAAFAPVTSASSSNARQEFVLEPQNQTTVVGTKVILPCQLKNKSGDLQWVQNQFGLGDLKRFDRYKMSRGGENGDFSLEIDPVSLDDEQDYECQVLGGNPPVLRSRPARLTVLVPPEAPRIVQGSSLNTTEESVIDLECVSSGGKPSARISWLVADRGVLTDGVTHLEERLDGLDTSRSVLKLTAKKHHHKRTFICQVQHDAEQFPRSTGIQLEVRFAPRVSVSVVGKNHLGWIEEGREVRVVCRADANPSNVTYKWFVDGRHSNATGSELVLRNVSRSLHNASVLCRVHNELGKSECSEKLNISYGPRFRVEPLPVYSADNGSTVTMTCDADGRPTPDIKWLFIHSDSNYETMVGTSPNLTLNVVTNNTGRYYCKAHVVGFPEITAKSARLLVNGKPVFFPIQLHVAHTGEVLVECEAISLPKYDKVTWSRNGKELSGDDADYHIKEEDFFPSGIKSVLTVKARNSAGMYRCSVSNAYGTDSVRIYLEHITGEAEEFQILVQRVTGVCIVFIVITVGVMLCRRYRTSSVEACKSLAVGDPEKDQLCRQTSDLSSNVSVTKDERNST